MKSWYTVETQEDIDLLMSTVNDFHDACIVSLSFQSGAFVDDEMVMYYGDANERIISMIFQRQWEPANIYIVANVLKWRVVNE